mmetsp:Transcript_8345/g.9750  ORF Transcript_8345/g.9750 Transcript_8345/m.9750 type:complete len:163 (-) Transcript_8345:52-540(-)
MFAQQQQSYDPVNLEEGITLNTADPVSSTSAISASDIECIPNQRVNVIPDTIRPPRLIPEDKNLPPTIVKRSIIAACGLTLTILFASWDSELFHIYGDVHKRWIEILGITELLVAIAFALGTVAGGLLGKWEALVPGFVIYKAATWINMVVVLFVMFFIGFG